jgi:hypothetical protein
MAEILDFGRFGWSSEDSLSKTAMTLWLPERQWRLAD